MALCATAEEIVKQNNAIDIYEEYWADMDDASNLDTEAASMSTVAQLKDPHGAAGGRGAQNVSWHPDGSHKVCPLRISVFKYRQYQESMQIIINFNPCRLSSFARVTCRLLWLLQWLVRKGKMGVPAIWTVMFGIFRILMYRRAYSHPQASS